MRIKKAYPYCLKAVFSFVVSTVFVQSNSLYAGTPLGSGVYYDEQHISKLAEEYPNRVSKDAGYPLIDHYTTLKSSFRGSHYGLMNKALTSGMWWTPLLAIDKPAKEIKDTDYLSPSMLLPNPFYVRLSEKGIDLGIPLQHAIVDKVHIDRGYENTLDITLTTGDLTGTAPLVEDYSDWMVKAQWADHDKSLLSINVVEGSPFLFIEKKNNQPNVYLQFNNSQDARLLTSGPVSVFKTKNASQGDYRYYAYYSNPNKTQITWETATGAVIEPVDAGGNGYVVPATRINLNTADDRYFSIALIPATTDIDAIDFANRLKPYAHTAINNTAIRYEYDSTDSSVVTHFNYETQTRYEHPSLKNQPLTMLYPWQVKSMSQEDKASCLFSDECATDKGIVKTLKGNMHLYVVPLLRDRLASFRITLPFRGILPVLPNRLSSVELQKIGTYSFDMPDDPHLKANNPWTDTYATGKLLSREAELIKIANQLIESDSKYKAIRSNGLERLKTQMSSFLTGLNLTEPSGMHSVKSTASEGAWFFSYNKRWNTMIGFPSGFFTATTLTDHAFHWGYFIDAAATIAQFDKTWAQQYGGMVNLMIRDIINYQYGKERLNDDTHFPHFRSFDPYAALSSALGMPYSPDSTNEEDSAEFMHFAQSIILWGVNTQGISFDGDDSSSHDILETGLYLYATEEQGLNHYHFNQNPNSGVFPNAWRNDDTRQNYYLIGNIWGGKLDRATYFCTAQPCYYQNLASNTLPLTAGSFYLGFDPDFVRRVYADDAKNPCSNPSEKVAYCGTLLKYLALGDSVKASNDYTQYYDATDNEPDSGESKPSIYYWIQNLNHLGYLNQDIIADTPAYSAFGSNESLYVSAYNGETTVKTVHFYRKGQLICSMKVEPGETKASLRK